MSDETGAPEVAVDAPEELAPSEQPAPTNEAAPTEGAVPTEEATPVEEPTGGNGAVPEAESAEVPAETAAAAPAEEAATAEPAAAADTATSETPAAPGTGEAAGEQPFEAPTQASFTFEEASAPAPTAAPAVSAEPGTTSAKLFLGGLEWNTNEDGIRGYFSQFATVLDCMVLRERDNPAKSRGFGFVTIADEKKAEEILTASHELDGRMLTVRRAAPKGSGDPTRPGGGPGAATMAQANQAPPDGTEKKVFLGGLLHTMTEEMVRTVCGQYGTITDVQMMNSEQNSAGGRGFGFVSFTEADAAQKLIQIGTVEIEQNVINVQRAQPKGQRTRNNFGGGGGGYGGGYGGGNYGGRGGYGGGMGGYGGRGVGMGGGMGMGGYGNCGMGMGGCGGYGGGMAMGGYAGGMGGMGMPGMGYGGAAMGGGMAQMGQMGMGTNMNMGGAAMYGQQGGMGGDGGYGPQRTDRNFQRPGPY